MSEMVGRRETLRVPEGPGAARVWGDEGGLIGC